MALGLNIVVGFAGLLDLGYVAFFAIGAFVMGWLGSQQFPNVNGGKGIHILTPAKSAFGTALPGIHINFFLVIFIAAAFTAIWGVILGAPTLRLRGDYLAIVTLAFGEIVPRVFENSTSGIFGIGSTDFSNGRQGITPIDKINLPGSSTTFTSLQLKPFYWVALGMLLLVIFLNIRLRDSRLGRAWIAVREDEVAAASMGVNLVARSSGPTRSAPRSAASPARSSAPTTTRSTSTSSSSGSRCSSSPWSSSAAWATSGA